MGWQFEIGWLPNNPGARFGDHEEARIAPLQKPQGCGTRPLHDSLPFFSKVNLRNAVKLLQSNGYNVKLAKIKQVRQPLPEVSAVTE
jgi:hypothetical protein